MQLVVFEILPTFGKYQEAERLITDPKDLEKLRKIQHLHEEQKAQQRLAKQNQEKERAAALEQAKQQTLKYKSIKEIQTATKRNTTKFKYRSCRTSTTLSKPT